ncbi:polyphosphate kinase 2 family protein [Propylenella binzhouense]|uniref:Polyphosphate kinase 2 family protein n=1 Tax=Propylenella binzhouense TaxID=2555902 RepID=A0A964T8I4_9HYPH|nr:polyphosphate kinase 2 family protein [Propylenella binzhouense]MYZ49817.1 polyphosphate kinase 2 family protein [Propylenella binzhouense]
MTSLDDLLVPPGSKVRLADRDPETTLHYADKREAKAATAQDAAEIDRLQDILYAEGRRALLVILQGTDTAGKDGTIRDVFNRTGPIGIRVMPFRAPSEEDLAHDFLWRVHRSVPSRGTIGIFNRSHYEDVLVVKVRELVPADEIERRYEQINAFEKMLVETGTTILKFMLHISKGEQKKRLQARLDDPRKHWKFRAGDLDDRARWDDFQAAYETMLSRCSTEWAPWRIVPADRKWVRSAAIASIVRRTLEDMEPRYPVPDWKPEDFKIV